MNHSFAFVYSSRFGEYSYGDDHPFKVLRFRLAYELMVQLGLLSGANIRLVETPYASEQELHGFHRSDYLETLREFSQDHSPRANFLYGLGDAENPVFYGMYDWARLSCGGTLEAVRQIVDHGCRAAFNMAGGHHHAHEARASGFSYLNDAVVAIKELLRRGLRVAYVDIDAHHGDGVQQAFYESDQVLTISLHETGQDFFPFSGFIHELGTGPGYGYSVNVPFCRHSDDLIFEQAFRRMVRPLLASFKPDVLITQMGVDGLKVNVARAWSLLWATMIGAQVPDLLPAVFEQTIAGLGYDEKRLRDRPRLALPNDFARAQQDLERTLSALERKLWALHGIGGGQ